MTEYPSLAAALAAVQAKLPSISKGETAVVPTKSGGKYTYSYADLADVSKVILPMLGAVGLSWVTRPTLKDGGGFVLAYELMHVSGDGLSGEYPLPDRGSPQEIGSAITYARRYALCSVTGVAPEADDDDGASASQRPAQRDQWEQAAPVQQPPTPEQVGEFDALIERVKDATTEDRINAIGQDVHVLKSTGGITPMQYERLARVASARLAEIGMTAAHTDGDRPEAESK